MLIFAGSWYSIIDIDDFLHFSANILWNACLRTLRKVVFKSLGKIYSENNFIELNFALLCENIF